MATTDAVIQADTAEEFRSEVVSYFEVLLDQNDRFRKVLPPLTKRDEAVQQAYRKTIVNLIAFWRDVTIVGKES